MLKALSSVCLTFEKVNDLESYKVEFQHSEVLLLVSWEMKFPDKLALSSMWVSPICSHTIFLEWHSSSAEVSDKTPIDFNGGRISPLVCSRSWAMLIIVCQAQSFAYHSCPVLSISVSWDFLLITESKTNKSKPPQQKEPWDKSTTSVTKIRIYGLLINWRNEKRNQENSGRKWCCVCREEQNDFHWHYSNS